MSYDKAISGSEFFLRIDKSPENDDTPEWITIGYQQDFEKANSEALIEYTHKGIKYMTYTPNKKDNTFSLDVLQVLNTVDTPGLDKLRDAQKNGYEVELILNRSGNTDLEQTTAIISDYELTADDEEVATVSIEGELQREWKRLSGTFDATFSSSTSSETTS